jgi:hypothetical protein
MRPVASSRRMPNTRCTGRLTAPVSFIVGRIPEKKSDAYEKRAIPVENIDNRPRL